MEGGGDVSGQIMDFDKELAQLLFGDGGIGPSSDLANTIQDINNENNANQQEEQIVASNIGVNDVIPPAPMDPVPFDMSPEAIVDSLPDLMGFDVNLLHNNSNSSSDDLDSQLAQLTQDPFLFEQSQQLLQEVSSLININEDQGIAMSEPSNPGSVQEVLSPASVASSASTVIIDGGGGGRVRNSSSRSSDEGIAGMSNSNSGAGGLDVITDVEQILEEKPNVEELIAQTGPATPANDQKASPPSPPVVAEATNSGNKNLLATQPDPVALLAVASNLCYVCKEKAGKHNYYGGRVCPSCRAFFRRAVQSKYYEIFFCTKGEKCEINLTTRRSCQYCRFKKCLESGMRIAWVLPDGERTKKYNKVVKLQQEQDEIINRKFMPLAKGPIITISQEELAILNKTQAAVCKIAMSTFSERLREGDNFMVELCSVSYYGGKVSLDFLKAFYKFCKNITLELFMGMEEFKSLPINDRKQLMEVNGNLIHHYKAAISIDDDACMVQTIDAAAKSGKYPALTNACETAAKMGVQKRDKPRLEYSQFYQSPWAATLEDEEKHYWLVQQLRNWPRETPRSRVDDLQVTLGKLVIAFCGDFVKLERPDIVEKVQMRYSYLLQRYLKSKYGDQANSKFVQGLMLTSYARQIDEIQSRRLPV